MTKKTKKNRLSVYLVKEEYWDTDAILKNANGLESRVIESS